MRAVAWHLVPSSLLKHDNKLGSIRQARQASSLIDSKSKLRRHNFK